MYCIFDRQFCGCRNTYPEQIDGRALRAAEDWSRVLLDEAQSGLAGSLDKCRETTMGSWPKRPALIDRHNHVYIL